EIWLDGQGQLGSLVNGFDRYIEHGFAMKPSRHFHYGHVVSGMCEQWVDQNLQDVRERAEAIVHDLEKSPVA
ncbi:MAG: NAD(P)H dehydrogenase, partial [Sphingomonas sp.]